MLFFRIMYYHRHKSVVKDWFGNGLSTPVDGKVEFIQETEFSSASIQMDLTGLNGEVGRYGIYSVGNHIFKKLICDRWNADDIYFAGPCQS